MRCEEESPVTALPQRHGQEIRGQRKARRVPLPERLSELLPYAMANATVCVGTQAIWRNDRTVRRYRGHHHWWRNRGWTCDRRQRRQDDVAVYLRLEHLSRLVLSDRYRIDVGINCADCWADLLAGRLYAGGDAGEAAGTPRKGRHQEGGARYPNKGANVRYPIRVPGQSESPAARWSSWPYRGQWPPGSGSERC